MSSYSSLKSNMAQLEADKQIIATKQLILKKKEVFGYTKKQMLVRLRLHLRALSDNHLLEGCNL